MQVGVLTQITIEAVDPDMDTITFSLSNASTITLPEGIAIDSGELNLKQNSQKSWKNHSFTEFDTVCFNNALGSVSI